MEWLKLGWTPIRLEMCVHAFELMSRMKDFKDNAFVSMLDTMQSHIIKRLAFLSYMIAVRAA